MSLPTRKIGDADVSAIGFGAMSIAAYYATTIGEEERFKVRSHWRRLCYVVGTHRTLLHTALRRCIRERLHQLGHCRCVRRQRNFHWQMVRGCTSFVLQAAANTDDKVEEDGKAE